MEDLYPPKTRLAREERTAAALGQLVAAKEWPAVSFSLDEKADEEDMRLAEAIALSFGIELRLYSSESA